jgi:hypothetical protein
MMDIAASYDDNLNDDSIGLTHILTRGEMDGNK